MYVCGDWLGLCAQDDGDVAVDAGERGKVYSPRLYQQLVMRFPGAQRLYLHPHENLLLITDDPDWKDAADPPPPDYFCRLLVGRCFPAADPRRVAAQC